MKWLALLCFSSMLPCSWCHKWSKKNHQKTEQKEYVDLDSVLQSIDQGDLPEEFTKELKKNLAKSKTKNISKDFELSKEIGEGLYKVYLSVYYPRALVLTDHFFDMCPSAIEASINEFVEIFSKKPWFYFKDAPDGFQLGHYWEIIIDQYKTIDGFLAKGIVDESTNTVFLDTSTNPLFRKKESGIRIEQYWRSKGMDNFYRFHASYSDYLIKMFNEGIQNEDYKQARKFYRLLIIVVKQLQGSLYEAEYNEALKVSNWLLSELKRRLDQQDILDSLEG